MNFTIVYVWNRDSFIDYDNLWFQAETDSTKSGVRPQSAPIESGAKKKPSKNNKDAK